MVKNNKVKPLVLLFGDIFLFFTSLWIALFIRFRENFFNKEFSLHLLPFSIIFVVWILIFYILKLYDLREAKNNLDFFRTLIIAFALNFISATIIFYSLPFGITPKTNLIIFSSIAFVLIFLWRTAINKLFIQTEPIKICFFGQSQELFITEKFIEKNRQLGFLKTEPIFSEIIVTDDPKSVFESESEFATFLENNGKVFKTTDFYEMIFRKIPISGISEDWIISFGGFQSKFSDLFKRIFDIIFSFIGILIFFPIILLVSIAIKVESKGTILYRQKRIGKYGKQFIICKLRSMVKNADKIGLDYTEENDKRITRVGKFIRKIHLDEIPQLWNILKGEMSFVGPRPENEKLVKDYEKEIKLYRFRSFVRPGIMGWAQLNYPYGDSREDAIRKLEYDLYYIKKRGLIFDLGIIFQTVRRLFEKHAR